MIDVKMSTGSDPMGARGFVGWTGNTPKGLEADFECPLCKENPKLVFAEPRVDSIDPLAARSSVGINCKCYGQSQVYDEKDLTKSQVTRRLVDNFRAELYVRMERAGTPPKGVSLRDWVLEMGKYFGARNQMPPRTADLSETEKLFIWDDIK